MDIRTGRLADKRLLSADSSIKSSTQPPQITYFAHSIMQPRTNVHRCTCLFFPPLSLSLSLCLSASLSLSIQSVHIYIYYMYTDMYIYICIYTHTHKRLCFGLLRDQLIVFSNSPCVSSQWFPGRSGREEPNQQLGAVVHLICRWCCAQTACSGGRFYESLQNPALGWSFGRVPLAIPEILFRKTRKPSPARLANCPPESEPCRPWT